MPPSPAPTSALGSIGHRLTATARGFARRLEATARGLFRGFDRRYLLPMAAAFSGFVGFGAIIPVLPVHMRIDLGASDVELGVVIGVTSIAALSTRMASGRLVDIRGAALGLVIGLSLCSLAGLLFFAPAGVIGLGVARIVQGFGQAFVFAGCTALTVSRAPADQRARALGLLGVGSWGGMAIGPLFGALLGSFALTALFVMVLPLPLLVVILRSHPGGPGHRRAPDAPRSRLFPVEAIRPGVAQGLINVGSAAMTGFLVLRLAEVGGGGAVAFGAFAASVLLARMFLTPLVDQTGPAAGMTFGAGCFAAGMVVVALAPMPSIGVLGAALCGIGFGFPWPSIATFMLGRVGEHEKGGAIGALTVLSDIAAFLGAIFAGVVAGSFGYSALFFCAAAVVLGSAVVMVPAMRGGGRRTQVERAVGFDLGGRSESYVSGDR